jgi:uncharacterized protein YbaP (TraB family)
VGVLDVHGVSYHLFMRSRGPRSHVLRLSPFIWVLVAAIVVLAGRTSVAEAKPKGPALWVVKDSDTTVFLFGSLHSLPVGTVWLTGAIRDAYEESEEVVIEEIDPDLQTREAIQKSTDATTISERYGKNCR